MKEKYYTIAKTISRWKIDTPLENWLAQRADHSEWWKSLYVLYYRFFDTAYYRKGLPLMDREIARHADNKACRLSKKQLRTDMTYSLHRFGATFEDYFLYRFYERNVEERAQFNTLKMQYGYCELVNSPDIRQLFEDKGACYKTFQRFYKRDLTQVNGENDMEKFREFVRKHPSFICKPTQGHSGQGIRIYHDIRHEDSDTLTAIARNVNWKFVAEELICQADEMKRLHPESVNTLRLATFTVNGKVTIFGASLRTGRGTSDVDNAGAGGVYATVSELDGTVISDGCDDTGHCYTKHPDSQITFRGFTIPLWEEAVELTKEMALTVEGATMIAWDLALSTKGWLMIEGNDVGGHHSFQAPLQRPIKPRIIELIDEYYKQRP